MTTKQETSLFDDAELDAILNGMDADTEPKAVAVETIEAVELEPIDMESDKDDIDSALNAIEADMDLKKALMETEVGSESTIETIVSKPSKVKGASEVVVPLAKPKISRGTGVATLLPSEALKILFGEEVKDGVKLDDTLDPFPIECMDHLAKKVKEKIVNAFECSKHGKPPSVYTQRALAILKTNGFMTVDMLKNDYLSRPYSMGTTSAQSSQMMIVLPALKIATRSGNTLTLNMNSTLFPLLTNSMGSAGSDSTDEPVEELEE